MSFINQFSHLGTDELVERFKAATLHHKPSRIQKFLQQFMMPPFAGVRIRDKSE